MRIPQQKLEALLLYFYENTEKRYLGKVKLMKLFYFLDFGHVKRFGLPVTYDNYVNLEHGPIPSTIKNLVDQVEENEHEALLAGTIRVNPPSNGLLIHQVVGVRKLSNNDLKLFSDSERSVMEDVCRRFGTLNTQLTEDASHKEAPWRDTVKLQPILYSLAGRDPDSSFTEEEISVGISIVA